MERVRGFLIFALAIVTYFLFLAWQEDYGVKPEPQKQVSQQPEITFDATPASDTVEATNVSSDLPSAELPQPTVPQANNQQRLVRVKTDTLDLVIDTRGGDIIQANLVKYHKELNRPDMPIEMLMQNDSRTYVAQSGILGAGAPDSAKKRHVYSIAQDQFELAEGQDVLEVPMVWTNESGVTYRKNFVFNRGSHLIDVVYEIDNPTSQTLSHRIFTQLKRDWYGDPNGESSAFLTAFLGAAYANDESKFEKLAFDDMRDEPIKTIAKGGWVAIIQHYFLTAWVPAQEEMNQISSSVVTQNGVDLSIMRIMQQGFEVAPGTSVQKKSSLFIGPKKQGVLEKIAPGLDLSVDYGILWWIGQPLFWLLTAFQGLVGNWGMAIILVTLSVKILLFPIFSKQYRSFAKLRQLTPKIEQLKQRYGDDRAKMGPALMELYRKEKANPLGGCVPMIITMPVFFALYWVLMESIEIRHQPFFLWVNDLSSQDPLFILPLIMGASMWLMQKMQPTAATMDPMQQKMMQAMPIIFTVFFLFFPSGLVLYWIVNNLLSIAQQVYITKKFEAETAAKGK